MFLRYSPARPADFSRFYNAFFPHERDNGEFKTIIKGEWDALSSHPTTLSLMVEDIDQEPETSLMAFAQAVFVTDDFARTLHEGLTPWVCGHLTRSLTDGFFPLLSFKEICAAQVGDGLTGVITNWFVATPCLSEREAIRVQDYLHRGFAIFWRGYNLKEVLVETTGPNARCEAMCAGFQVLTSYEEFQKSHPESPCACLLHLTRQMVLDQHGWLVNGGFAYQKPQFGFGFTLREQEMLRWALTGADDAELARMLCLSIWMIRKRWQDIYQRVEEQAPDLLPHAGDAKCGAQARGRGAEKRGALLRFLDARPEELYAPKAGETRGETI